MRNIQVVITKQEMMNVPRYPDPHIQAQMYVNRRLKAAGIPAKGTFLWGGVTEGIIEVMDDPETFNKVFRWRDA